MDISLTPDGHWRAPLLQHVPDHEIVIPGSKSATARALVVAALADGPSTIVGGLEARDTQLMRNGLRALGVHVHTSFRPESVPEAEFGSAWAPPRNNATAAHWHVEPPQEFVSSGVIDVGLAGTVLRFLLPVAAMAHGDTHFFGDEAMASRPLLPLLDALVDIGAGIPDDARAIPLTIHGRPDLPGGPVLIDSSSSSQFISGMLLSGARFAEGLDIRHAAGDVPSMPHIRMTMDILRHHGVIVDQVESARWIVHPGPIRAGHIVIEPDLSTAAPFLAAAMVSGGTVRIPHWPRSSSQPGALLLPLLEELGATVRLAPGERAENATLEVVGPGHAAIPGFDVDLSAAAELTPVVSVLAALAHQPSRIRGVGHIRGHETDRLAALEANFTALGASVAQTEDGLAFRPALMHGGPWQAHADHRLAQAAAVAGLVVPDVVVDDVFCTSKTMPSFPMEWQALVRGARP